MYLKGFFSTLLKDWVALMSGGASIVAAFLAAYFQIVADNPKSLLWAVSGICLVMTTYRVWVDEHRALLDEMAKNARPKISGAIHKVKVSPHTFSIPASPKSVIGMEVHIYNERPVSTTLRRFELEISCGENTYYTDQVYPGTIAAEYRGEKSGVVPNLGRSLNLGVLEFGHHKEGWIQFNLDGVKPEAIEGCATTLLITDGFDLKHKIS
jgi:hypothetical protein